MKVIHNQLYVLAHHEIDWMDDINDCCLLPHFKWDAECHALLEATLNAWYTLLYGLKLNELLYILYPQDLSCEDFSGETFRVLEALDRQRPSWEMGAHLVR